MQTDGRGRLSKNFLTTDKITISSARFEVITAATMKISLLFNWVHFADTLYIKIIYLYIKIIHLIYLLFTDKRYYVNEFTTYDITWQSTNKIASNIYV
jgi:hypothetical protein